jgi:hypothetical protein
MKISVDENSDNDDVMKKKCFDQDNGEDGVI